ncbi:SET and MYND domain-containing protein 4-like [Ochlerotatus camptorhynchus]|uniref:SET and MYND domain-containing protein 4-like n=1 Tax=Ochlerotatus camptorhynchus TaxID=644619 RepID=UPI0031D2E626
MDMQDLPKCCIRSAQIRRSGNLLYAKRQYRDAMEKYNQSICSAPNDSADLDIGFANRSAVYYEQCDYKMALANIALVRKHIYPEQLMPKLVIRETNCRAKLEEIDRNGSASKHQSLTFNLEANPTIPFLAKGISARKHPVFGTSMVAERDFKAGNVILQEKPMQVSVCHRNLFTNCNHCFSENLLHLIPCPNCTSAMFCDADCMRHGLKIHRFECGVTANLSEQNDYWIGPRLFFRGLTLFDDDIQKMMAFCKACKQTERRFTDLDYMNYNPLEEFKMFLTCSLRLRTKPVINNILHLNAMICFMVYMQVPLVKSLICDETVKYFTLKCFLELMIQDKGLSIQQEHNCRLYPVASGFSHSCDPNTLLLDYGGQLKLIVLRPIRRGAQVLISHGPLCSQEPEERQIRLDALQFHCRCNFCDEEKHRKWLAKLNRRCRIVPAHLEIVQRLLTGAEFCNADKLNALQQFVQRYSWTHPHNHFDIYLEAYRVVLNVCYQNEMTAAMRQKIAR